jgi:replicative DNA helicase
MAERQFGIDFQIKMLAVAVREPLFLQLYNDTLRPAIFSTTYLRDLSSWIIDFHGKYKSPPTRSAMQELLRQNLPSDHPLTDGYQHVLDQIYSVDLSDAAFVQEQLSSAARHLAVRTALRQMDEANNRLDFDALEPLLSNALKTGAGLGDLGLELTKDAIAAILKFSQLEQTVETGYLKIQRAVGNFCTGELSMIVAPPNQGKTAALGNLAYGAARHDNPVFYYTHEIGAERMLCRFLAKMTRLPTNQLQDPRELDIECVRQSIHRFSLSTHGTVYVKYFPAKTATIDTLRGHLGMAIGQGIRPKLVIVDYIDLLANNSKGETHEKLRENCERLRAMADEFNVHIMTASQSTRETLYADVIDLDKLAESWGKAATADTIIAHCQTQQEQEAEVARWFVAKARNETRGKFVHLATNYKILNIYEISKEVYVDKMRAAGFDTEEDGTTDRRSKHNKQTLDDYYKRRLAATK